jgi:Clr5 domain
MSKNSSSLHSNRSDVMFSPQPSFDALGMYGHGSNVPSEFMFAQEWHPDWATGGPFREQRSLPVDNPPSSSRKVSQPSAQKRARKVPTISADSWKPYESRIQQLYVQEGKSLEELREIVNKEFRLTAK